MKFLIALCTLFPFFSTINSLSQSRNDNSLFPDYPEMKFIVISDPHYYDNSLGSEGSAFQDYLDQDRKLLQNSGELMEVFIGKVEKSDARFILVCGDLTKDGELVNHLKMAEFLEKLKDTGKKVYVVPGNHDINNPESYSYSGNTKERVASIESGDFAAIYKNFGYGEAIRREENSLSYIAEPLEGLWLLGLDACRYNENPAEGHPVTGGKFNKATVKWIKEVLIEAREQNKSVIAFMHHGVLEHYKKQKKHYGEYVVDGYKKIAALLAENGVRMVFTGHYHAQDISMKNFGKNKFILDIQTGSFVTYPCPYRTVTISSDQWLKIESGFITSIPSNNNFAEYARNYTHSGIAGIAANTLIGMKVDSIEAWSLSDQVANAFIAHYSGDEIPPEKAFDMTGISFKGKFLIGFKKNLVKSLYHDLYPADNFLEMKLKSASEELKITEKSPSGKVELK